MMALSAAIGAMFAGRTTASPEHFQATSLAQLNHSEYAPAMALLMFWLPSGCMALAAAALAAGARWRVSRKRGAPSELLPTSSRCRPTR